MPRNVRRKKFLVLLVNKVKCAGQSVTQTTKLNSLPPALICKGVGVDDMLRPPASSNCDKSMRVSSIPKASTTEQKSFQSE